MNRLQAYLIIAVIFFIQVTFIGYLQILGTKPDLGLLFIIFIGLFFGWESALETGFVFGLLKDIFSVDIFGINAVSTALVGFIAGFLSRKFSRESRSMQFFTVFFFTLLYFLIHYIISSVILRTQHISLAEYLFGSFIPASLYTALASALVFPLLIKSFALKEDEEYL